MGKVGCSVYLDRLWKHQDGHWMALKSAAQVVVYSLRDMTHHGKDKMLDILDKQ